MKVINFDEEEAQLQREINKAKYNSRDGKDVEDLSDYANKENKDDEKLTAGSILKELGSLLINIAICFVIVFLITHFIGQRTVVSGSSMEDTLSNGDNLIVDRISYRFGDPERFDVVVFPYQYEEDTYYIKRIIGLPGETVHIDDAGTIYINGQVLEENYGTEVMTNPGLASQELILGPDEYFVLGDNRNNSTDSRFDAVGNIKGADIVGKAWVRFYPFDEIGFIDNLE